MTERDLPSRAEEFNNPELFLELHEINNEQVVGFDSCLSLLLRICNRLEKIINAAQNKILQRDVVFGEQLNFVIDTIENTCAWWNSLERGVKENFTRAQLTEFLTGYCRFYERIVSELLEQFTNDKTTLHTLLALPAELSAWIHQLQTEDQDSNIIPAFPASKVITIQTVSGGPLEVPLTAVELLGLRTAAILYVRAFAPATRYDAEAQNFFVEQMEKGLWTSENPTKALVLAHMLRQMGADPSHILANFQDRPAIRAVLSAERQLTAMEIRTKLDQQLIPQSLAIKKLGT